MNRLFRFAALFLIFSLCIPARSAHVRWTFANATNSPSASRNVFLTPLYTYSINGTNFIVGDRQQYTLDSSGSVIVSNLIAGSYRMEHIGPIRTTVVTNTIPDTNGLINAVDYSSVPAASFTAAYSQGVSDSRFIRTNTIKNYVLKGDNMTFVTNANGSLTISSSGGGTSGALTNNDTRQVTLTDRLTIGSGATDGRIILTDGEAKSYTAIVGDSGWQFSQPIEANGSLLTALSGANITAGTISTNKMDATAYAAFIGGGGSGDVTAAGLAAGSYPIRATNTLVTTISSRGIANSQSSITNNGAMFGPDTPGTTTTGIQEAWNSFNKGTNWGPRLANMVMEFGDGYFYYTNNVKMSNVFNSAITIRGQGKMATALVYAGTQQGTNNFWITGGGNTNAGLLDLPIHARIENIGFTSLQQHTNVMLKIDHMAFVWLDDVLFTGWNTRTNQESGATLTQFPTKATEPFGLVGAYIEGGYDAGMKMTDVFFEDLAVGMRTSSDHIDARGISSSAVSYGTTANNPTNKWPTSSIYSLGAVIIRESATYDDLWSFGNFYACRMGFAYIGSSAKITLDGFAFESCDYPVVSDTEAIPVVRDTANLASTVESSNGYILKTPTTAWAAATNSVYLPTTTSHPNYIQYGAFPTTTGYNLPFYIRRANTNQLEITDSGEAIFYGKASGAEQPFCQLSTAGTLLSTNGISGTNIFNGFTGSLKVTNSLYSFNQNASGGLITNTAAGYYNVSLNMVLAGNLATCSFFLFTNGVRSHIGVTDVAAVSEIATIGFSGKLYLPANTRLDIRNYGDDPATMANVFFTVEKQ